MIPIKIKRLTDTAKLPTRGSAGAAGYDLYADVDQFVSIQPGSYVAIQTNIAMEIPHGYFGAVYPRSGLATKKGLRLPNSVGIIDEDYRGSIGVGLYNDSNILQTIQPHERVAQIIFQPYEEVDFEEVTELSDTERGTGGFGSTGKA